MNVHPIHTEEDYKAALKLASKDDGGSIARARLGQSLSQNTHHQVISVAVFVSAWKTRIRFAT